jgi:hypothetical protein
VHLLTRARYDARRRARFQCSSLYATILAPACSGPSFYIGQLMMINEIVLVTMATIGYFYS